MLNHTASRWAALAATAVISLIIALAACAAPALAAAGEGCPNEQVRSESNIDPATGAPYSQGLPECRAYEMVSPLEKQNNPARLSNAASLTPGSGIAAPGGDVVGIESNGNFGEPGDGFGADDLFIAERGATGWTTKSILDPPSILQGPHGISYSEDLTHSVFCGGVPTPAERIASTSVLCALGDFEGDSDSFLTTPDYPRLNNESAGGLDTVGASSDLSTVLFKTGGFEPLHLLPEDESGYGIYAVSGLGTASPTLSLVNVTDSDQELNDAKLVNNAAVVGLVSSSGSVNNYQAISDSGEVVYFTAEPVGGGVQTLYARVGGRETVSISTPSPSECTSCSQVAQEGLFQGASADGSKVFFLTTQQLVNADTDKTQDLYMYDFDNSTGRRIVQVSGGGPGDLTPGVGADVQGVVRLSSDGSHVYFVATGVLVSLPNQTTGEAARAGAENLYVYDSESGETQFVADLCSGSGESGSVGDSRCPASSTATDASLWDSLASKGPAQATPDGRYLVFSTYARLITSGPEADTDNAMQVYRYDAETGELVRVSVGEPGYPASDNGNTEGESSTVLSGHDDYEREISENGSDIIFLTPEKLQADDDSTNPSVTSCPAKALAGCSVYLWHYTGSSGGGNSGEVSMISDGQDPLMEASAPLMSANGSNIFFVTHTQLVGQDKDGLTDVYDARVDGGFPAPVTSACTGEECQGPLGAGSPAVAPGGSATQAAGENLALAPVGLAPALESKPASKPKAKAKALTRAQKLAAALKACKKKAKRKRAVCKSRARKRYGPVHKKARKKTKSKQTDRRGS